MLTLSHGRELLPLRPMRGGGALELAPRGHRLIVGSIETVGVRRSVVREARFARLVPSVIVDRLPIDWWRPGNLHVRLRQSLHFCTRDEVRSIELNGRVVGLGRRRFPLDRWDEEAT